MLIDCHTHTEISPDSECKLHDLVEAAVEKGIKILTVTDHFEINEFEKGKTDILFFKGMSAVDLEKSTAKLKLLKGIELGQSLSDKALAQALINKYDFDFVLGSIHAISGELDFYFADYFKMTDDEIDNMLLRYFNEVYKLALWNKFDSLAHITYPFRYIINAKSKRSINLDFQKYDEIITDALKLIISNGKAIENNSSSMRNSKEGYELNYRYLKLFYDLGGRNVTVGSDSHTACMVGDCIEKSYEMLKEIGFKYVTYFEKRQPIQIKI